MDHTEVRGLLELAAVEPGGLERLAAGDTDEAAAVAGHLAGCPDCSDEARRIIRAAPILRESVRAIPPEGLRDRTLSTVRELGRIRPAPALSSIGSAADESTPSGVVDRTARHRTRRLGWPIALAAAVVVAIIGAGVLVTARLGTELNAQRAQIQSLATLHEATLRVSSATDARRVVLSNVSDATVAGAVVFSAAGKEIVISASGLTEPTGGAELTCWMLAPEGLRYRVGRMAFADGLAYWVGRSDELADAGPGTTFGVSLVGPDGKPIDRDVLVGTVSAD